MSTETCKACENSGLPILFLYHSAVAKDAAFAPLNAAKLKEHDASVKEVGLPPLKYARYVLRTLRPGMYLHVYHETPPRALKLAAARRQAGGKAGAADPDAAHWEVFRVLPNGALVPEGHPHFVTGEAFACRRDGGSHLLTTVTYRLQDAHAATGLWVAVGANLWDRKLRAQNKMKPEVMQRIDIAKARTAGESYVRPTAQWLAEHVADFALFDLQHAKRNSTSVLAPLSNLEEMLCQRMLALSAGHPLTKGKGFVFPLRDPVGTAEALSDIARARYQQGLDYSYSQRHPLGALAGIEFIRKRVYGVQLATLHEQSPLRSTDLVDAKHRPLIDPAYQREIPSSGEMPQWVRLGTVRLENFQLDRKPGGELPNSARWLQLKGMPQYGIVIAPAADMAQLKAKKSTQKMDRLHKRDEVEQFVSSFKDKIDAYNKLVSQHDEDRAQLLTAAALCTYFRRHFDPSDPNPLGATRTPGIEYMREVSKSLIGWGGVSAGLERAVRKLLLTEDIEGDDGWVWRGLVANDDGLFGTLRSFTGSQAKWWTDEEAKLDKTYDTVKGLLTDADFGPKVSWATGAGAGLSFGIMGAVAGAATHLAFSAAEKLGPAGAVQSVKASAQAAAQKVESATQKAADFFSSKEAALANNVQAWCHQQKLILDGALNKKPPARPLYARVQVTFAEALDLFVDMERQGTTLNEKNRKLKERIQAMPADVRDQKISLDFLTSDVDLQDAKNVRGLAGQAQQIGVNFRGSAGIPVQMLTVDQLGQLYRKAHRFDALKSGVLRLADLVERQTSRMTTGAIKVAVLPGKAAAGAVRGAVDPESRLSIFGAFLQWRLHEVNQGKIEALVERLEKTPNLSPEQREAIEDAIAMTRVGMWDNKCGITGGVAEVVATGASNLRLVGTAALATTTAAVLGACGNVLNATQNFMKAFGKRADGDTPFAIAYAAVGAAYMLAAVGSAGAGVEVAAYWLARRGLLQGSIRGATGIAGTAMRLRGLSFTGWGLVLTVVAFAGEGIVVYFDRTALELWVENCYFGTKPKYRRVGESRPNPEAWESEAKDFESALKKAEADGAASV
ncbi:T6SS effector BTH_I2691 family protein [Caldimonas brevitalea]|uniref:Toxin VasX N-terminal region domain-containing protein n=1 Tax=Caldimonas brevitalea TaxID=413882 RepID=A0A0G3BLL3_9BURK|nr:T6SS effector BTH_I2691 family protein [Caldimonas brevitalea]AKJ30329.1 hypothetical protein AAW51_3638 [Caldimonas brevitalea]